MDASDADLFFHPVCFDGEPAFHSNGRVKLGDLIALHEVRIRIVFPIEFGVARNGAMQSQRCHHGIFNRLLVYGGEYPGHAQADRANMSIGWSAGIICAAPAIHLAPGQQLGMDFQSDYGFEFHIVS
jgi:hypothetical protein